MITISKTFDFDAAHSLPLVAKGHKCRRLHGHTYRVEILCDDRRGLTKGMVVDYQQIAEAWAPLHELLDHHELNKIEGLENPTTEVLAKWIYDLLDGANFNSGAPRLPLQSVKVYESSSTWCEYRP